MNIYFSMDNHNISIDLKTISESDKIELIKLGLQTRSNRKHAIRKQLIARAECLYEVLSSLNAKFKIEKQPEIKPKIPNLF